MSAWMGGSLCRWGILLYERCNWGIEGQTTFRLLTSSNYPSGNLADGKQFAGVSEGDLVSHLRLRLIYGLDNKSKVEGGHWVCAF